METNKNSLILPGIVLAVSYYLLNHYGVWDSLNGISTPFGDFNFSGENAKWAASGAGAAVAAFAGRLKDAVLYPFRWANDVRTSLLAIAKSLSDKPGA